ncbi:MAG TPA: nicotinate-nucleotide adenylyltransferase [Patescibacteria group bacterium]|nr:nicotinate-nucleotide adenylyltransferase [Patescibacteria group bacterium]
MKIGIYSGTFDPIHNGHLDFAKTAAKQLGLDRVYLLVEPTPRRKQGVKAFEHRAQMVKLAVKNIKTLGSIILEQPTFSVEDTLPILLERFRGSELFMLLGEDVLGHLVDWPHVDHLLVSVSFIIGARDGAKNDVLSSVKILEQTRGISIKYEIVEGNFPNISSSKIRLSLRRGEQPSEVPKVVLNYAKNHKLYSDQLASA